jgi:hypothetical protein
METFACSQCGEPLNEMARCDRRCQSCGATWPDEADRPPASVEATSHRSEHVAEFDLVPKHRDAPLPLEPILPDITIRRSDHGETLAVLALLLPLAAQGLALACHFDSLDIGIALGYGTVIVTALLLAVDAGFLGTFDLQGTRRCTPGALFFGILLFWIICYPVAFFRRRHFGRPNLGPFAVLVAGFFLGAPYLHNFTRFGVSGNEVPTCASREVIRMVDDLIRKSDMGPSVQSISGHREISYDRVRQTRKGQCLLKTPTETITVRYSVKMLNAENGTFEVDIEPIFPADPPSCTDAEVIGMVERIIREGPSGHLLKSVAGHEEIRYDREKKIRHGRCRVTLQDWKGDVRYKVYWADAKTGQFQVEIEP